MFNTLLTTERKMKAPFDCSFVRGIHWWSLDSLSKLPEMWETFPCHDVMGQANVRRVIIERTRPGVRGSKTTAGKVNKKSHVFMFSSLIVFSCDQAALRTLLSVCLSVRPSVTPFSLCSHNRIILKFSGVITIDRRDVHAKGQGQKSRSQRSWPHLAVSGP